MVESQPSKLLVAGPIPVSRSIFLNDLALFVLNAAPKPSATSVEGPSGHLHSYGTSGRPYMIYFFKYWSGFASNFFLQSREQK